MRTRFQPEVIANKDVMFFLGQVHRHQVQNFCIRSQFALSPSVSGNMCVCPFPLPQIVVPMVVGWGNGNRADKNLAVWGYGVGVRAAAGAMWGCCLRPVIVSLFRVMAHINQKGHFFAYLTKANRYNFDSFTPGGFSYIGCCRVLIWQSKREEVSDPD